MEAEIGPILEGPKKGACPHGRAEKAGFEGGERFSVVDEDFRGTWRVEGESNGKVTADGLEAFRGRIGAETAVRVDKGLPIHYSCQVAKNPCASWEVSLLFYST